MLIYIIGAHQIYIIDKDKDMILNKCINCDYFVTCQRNDKDSNKSNCIYFKNTYLQKEIHKINKERHK